MLVADLDKKEVFIFVGDHGVTSDGVSAYPQEVTDFYVYALGPANTNMQKAVIRSGKTPIYNSAYDEIIENDPMFGTYKWMKGMRDDVANSIPVPRNTFYLIQHQMYQKYIVEFTEDPSMTPETCAQLILEDSQAEIDKLAQGIPTINFVNRFECADGSLCLNMRTMRRGCRAVSRSTDRGKTWSKPYEIPMGHRYTAGKIHAPRCREGPGRPRAAKSA